MSLQTRSKVFGGHMIPNDGGVGETAGDGFRDECGVFGIYGHDDAARLAYLGLYQLQHRGEPDQGEGGRSHPAHRRREAEQLLQCGGAGGAES